MTKLIAKTSVFLAAAMLFARVSAAGTLSGELGVKASGFKDSSTSIQRLQNFSTIEDYAVSLLSLNYAMPKGYGLSLFSTKLGDDDVYGKVNIDLGKALGYEGVYNKIPHYISATSGYETLRIITDEKVTLFKNEMASLWGSQRNEDKLGRASFGIYAGHKVEDKAIGLNADFLNKKVIVGGSISEQELSGWKGAHDADGQSASLALVPCAAVFGEASYNKDTYDPKMANLGRPVEVEDVDYGVNLNILKNFSFTAFASDMKRDSATGRLKSIDAVTGLRTYDVVSSSRSDMYYSAALNYSGRLAKVGVSYKETSLELANADITKKKTDTLKVKASGKYSFLGLKAEATQGSRDISGVKSATLIDLNHLAGDFGGMNYSIDLLGFKKFGLTYYAKKTYSKSSPTKFGTQNVRTITDGVTSYYVADEKTTVTASFYDLQNRTTGRQFLYWGGVARDATNLQIFDGSTVVQFGVTHAADESMSVSADYTIANSQLIDPQQSTQIHENILSLGLEKDLARNFSLNLGFTYNRYTDDVDATFSRSNATYEAELTKKF